MSRNDVHNSPYMKGKYSSFFLLPIGRHDGNHLGPQDRSHVLRTASRTRQRSLGHDDARASIKSRGCLHGLFKYISTFLSLCHSNQVYVLTNIPNKNDY